MIYGQHILFCWVHIDQLDCLLFTTLLAQKEIKIRGYKTVASRHIFKTHYFPVISKRMKKHWDVCERTVSCCNSRMLETGYGVDYLTVAK